MSPRADMFVRYHHRLLVSMSLVHIGTCLVGWDFARAPRAAARCPSTVGSYSGSPVCTYCQFLVSCPFRICFENRKKCQCTVPASNIVSTSSECVFIGPTVTDLWDRVCPPLFAPDSWHVFANTYGRPFFSAFPIGHRHNAGRCRKTLAHR